jgi:hypothetical protein
VLSLLEEDLEESDSTARSLLQGFMIRLAGELRLDGAVPALVEILKEDDEWFNEECQRSLIRIGGDEVVQLVAQEFPTAEWHFRLYGAGVLEHTHSDLAAARCLDLFETEGDGTIKVQLGQAMLAQFATEAVEPVRTFVLDSTLDPEILELREALVDATAVLGVDFPERSKWKQEQQTSREQRRKLFAEKYGPATEVVNGWDENYFEDDDIEDDIIRAGPKIGRNDPCPCGSGKKYKNCCLNKPNGDPLLN